MYVCIDNIEKYLYHIKYFDERRVSSAARSGEGRNTSEESERGDLSRSRSSLSAGTEHSFIIPETTVGSLRIDMEQKNNRKTRVADTRNTCERRAR